MPKFKIVGNKKVDGKEPGSIIEIKDLDKILTLSKAGHIAAVDKKEDKKKSKKVIDHKAEEVDNG